MKFSNKVYHALKAFTMIVLPASGTFYFALANDWNLPHQQDVLGSIAALTTFLGTVLHISSATYKAPTDGDLVIDQTTVPGKSFYSLELTTPVEDLAGKETFTLGVKPKAPATPAVTIPPST